MKPARPLLALLATVLLPTAAGANYTGILKLPRSLAPGPDSGMYAFSSTMPAPFLGGSSTPDATHELKLGYKYSRFLSVEGQFNDFARTQDPFAPRAAAAS